MNCWKKVFAAACLTLLASPIVQAETLAITGGNFVFAHTPVDPNAPEGFCLFPPGARFSVVSDSFDGSIESGDDVLPFVGTGNASGCAYLQPFFGVAASFTGSFSWEVGGEEVNGTFLLLDFPTETFGVFEALIFIDFEDGGGAIASGLDFPFGGLGGNLGAAGVVGELIAGSIEL